MKRKIICENMLKSENEFCQKFFPLLLWNRVPIIDVDKERLDLRNIPTIVISVEGRFLPIWNSLGNFKTTLCEITINFIH